MEEEITVTRTNVSFLKKLNLNIAKLELSIRACLQLKFRPRLNSTLCVFKPLLVFTTKQLKKKFAPACFHRGEILTPGQTDVK